MFPLQIQEKSILTFSVFLIVAAKIEWRNIERKHYNIDKSHGQRIYATVKSPFYSPKQKVLTFEFKSDGKVMELYHVSREDNLNFILLAMVSLCNM